ncbi:recombinase family protein [Salisediminibacterium selenitireducens]|uniref:Resolvase domain protein n=1 Tax=Bacillus selenitireducens (strain ATCC 700615 / DSM 15326 / MLS10) TaxID=439292 RepID=D6XZU5_BACIE|nr:recombinase family protein [Salisediminibacterium selenitireducens]ADI00447.1 Resolvase domain protein [[Bacillus] selenitireducens MLS10]
MGKTITVIPAKSRQSEDQTSVSKKRVAAYCRVSTDHAEQLSSYEAQVKYYTDHIENHPEYDLAGIYADEGISGTSTKKREQFNKMIEDCHQGKIDRIITKSISRFARNTLDCLNYVRQLKDLGVGIIFEKENIDTLDAKGEVLLSILSSLAQDESRSISENASWGIRRRFESGQAQINHARFLGYEKNTDGELTIVPSEAETVKRIYHDFLDGKGAVQIAEELKEEGIPGWNGESKWRASTIERMLENEEYKGDVLMQKTYTVDFLTRKRMKNEGELPMYLIEDNHPAIIERDTWEAVQLEKQRRIAFVEETGSKKMTFNGDDYVFFGKVICGHCGSAFGRRTWHANDPNARRHVWLCKNRYVKGEKRCRVKNHHVNDLDLAPAFMQALKELLNQNNIKKWTEAKEQADPLLNYKLDQFIELARSQQGLSDYQPELVRRFLERVVIEDKQTLRFHFLDGAVVEMKANRYAEGWKNRIK